MISIKNQIVTGLLGLFAIPWMQIFVGGLFLLVAIRNADAAPCEFQEWYPYPKFTEVRVAGEEVLLLAKPEPTETCQPPTHVIAYLYDAKRQTLTRTTDEELHKKIMTLPIIPKNQALVPGGEFSHAGTRFKVKSFGIAIQKQRGEKLVKIPALPSETIKRNNLRGYDKLDRSSISPAQISMGILQGEWFIAGLSGGFPEGEGSPGGIAFFSLSQERWFVKWDELLHQHVTSMIPLRDRILVTTIEPGEYGSDGGGVFLVNLKKKSVQPLWRKSGGTAINEFAEIESYEAIEVGEEILVKGRYGIVFLTSELKVKNQFFWLKDLGPNQETIERLAERSEWVKWHGMNLGHFDVLERFAPSDKVGFLKALANSPEPIYPPEDCSDYFNLPIEVIPYLDMESVVLSPAKCDDAVKVGTIIRLMGRSKDVRWLPILMKVSSTTDSIKDELARAIKELEKLQVK